jgi:ABC-type molybdate transport system substrate-binding protein
VDLLSPKPPGESVGQSETKHHELCSIGGGCPHAVWSCGAAHAAEVTLIAPGGIRAAVQELIPAFERTTGHRVNATFRYGRPVPRHQ